MQGSGGRGIDAERVAEATLKAYLANQREVVVPWFYNLIILAYRMFPSVIEQGMRKRMKPLP